MGFRYFVMRKASNLKLAGYVRNCPDGDVELEAEGDEESLKILIDQLRQGPPLSRVDDLKLEWLEEKRGYKDFGLKW